MAAVAAAVHRLFQKLIPLLQALAFCYPVLRFISDYILGFGNLRFLRKNPSFVNESSSIHRSFVSLIQNRDKVEAEINKLSEQEEEEEDEEEGKTEFYLKFRFPTYEEFKNRESVNISSVPDHEKSLVTITDTFPVIESNKDASNVCEDDKGEKVMVFDCKESDVKTEADKTELVLSEGSSEHSYSDSEPFSQNLSDSESSEFEEHCFEIGNGDIKMEFKGFETSDDVKLSGEDFNEIKSSEKDESKAEEEEDEDLESLWEHQDLIEQLKMDIKRVRATGLPTIFEESESPKMFDDLKPWKIDDFQSRDCIGELHKFYKSYREKMRKLDIMNYQKMYAMGFLQLKDDHVGSITKHKDSSSPILPRNIWLCRPKIHGNDPAKKFMEELESDLEMVYVGQMCLSWEFLHWQYEKVWELWQSESKGARTFDEVASDFQQFQVLIQRFVEDEAFHGPRVQNYVKSRCVYRNLLQVPVIRNDNKSKTYRKSLDEYTITSDMLVQIVEESIRTLWRFIQADKNCSVSTTSTCKKLPEEEQKVVMDTKKILQKKEKKLKSILRSENCILRKLRQYRAGKDCNQVQCFFSQVDMSLVARVLNMSNITAEQLIWCHSKLNRIRFSNVGIHVEPSFLLFPC